MNCMQTLITEATAAYSPAGMSDVFFIPELMTAATIDRELTSRRPAEFSSEDFETGISMSPSEDDDDVEDEDEDLDDEDEDEDEDDLDEDDDEDDELEDDELDEEDDEDEEA
jgi:hypothetical protein